MRFVKFGNPTNVAGHTSHPDFSRWHRDGLLIKVLDFWLKKFTNLQIRGVDQ